MDIDQKADLYGKLLETLRDFVKGSCPSATAKDVDIFIAGFSEFYHEFTAHLEKELIDAQGRQL